MITITLTLLGMIAYGAIGAVCHILIVAKYDDKDHKKYTDGGELFGGAFWPAMFLPIYLAAWYEVDRNRKAREKKEKDELLRKEGLL